MAVAAANIFIVNAGLTFVLFGLTYWLGRVLAGRGPALLAVAWSLAQPEPLTGLALLAAALPYPEFDRRLTNWVRQVDEDGTADRARRCQENRRARMVQEFDGGWELLGGFGSLTGAQMHRILQGFTEAEFQADWAAARELHGDATTVAHLAQVALAARRLKLGECDIVRRLQVRGRGFQDSLLQGVPAQLARALGQLGGAADERAVAGGLELGLKLAVGDPGAGAVGVLKGADHAVEVDDAHSAGAKHAVERKQPAGGELGGAAVGLLVAAHAVAAQEPAAVRGIGQAHKAALGIATRHVDKRRQLRLPGGGVGQVLRGLGDQVGQPGQHVVALAVQFHAQ